MKWLVIAAIGIYAVIVAAMYVGQRGLVFPRRPERAAPAQAGFPEAQEHMLTTQDGERLVTWLRPPSGDKKPLFLMFLGNGDNLGIIAPRLREMTEDGSGVLAVAYRGYSGSTGSPSEMGLTHDAEAAYRFATTVVPANRIVLFGYSLGSGVAVPLATRHETAALILFAPFTSAVAVGAAAYPWLPVRFLMKDQFRSIDVVGRINVPTLVVHGERDEVVPISFGRELYAAITAPKRFAALPGADHFSLFENGAVRDIREFLGEYGLR
ncbi:MAG: alpha/beta hydrolase [Hyphomicrobiales bacterium]|nr:alpha/beta hydrolase [Hyphomicrobiales bacterium]